MWLLDGQHNSSQNLFLGSSKATDIVPFDLWNVDGVLAEKLPLFVDDLDGVYKGFGVDLGQPLEGFDRHVPDLREGLVLEVLLHQVEVDVLLDHRLQNRDSVFFLGLAEVSFVGEQSLHELFKIIVFFNGNGYYSLGIWRQVTFDLLNLFRDDLVEPHFMEVSGTFALNMLIHHLELLKVKQLDHLKGTYP